MMMMMMMMTTMTLQHSRPSMMKTPKRICNIRTQGIQT